MTIIADLVQRRAVLEERLKRIQVASAQIKQELEVYDTFVAVKDMFLKGKKKSRKKIGQLDTLLDLKDKYESGAITDAVLEDQVKLGIVSAEMAYTVRNEDFGSLHTELDEAWKFHEQNYGVGPAFIVVVNYDPDKHQHAINHDIGIFKNMAQLYPDDPKKSYFRQAIGKPFNKSQLNEVYKMGSEDLATLLTKGKIYGTNVPLIVREHENKDGLRERIGLLSGGSSRQLSASSGAFLMPGTAVYTQSSAEHQDDSKGYIRRFAHVTIDDYAEGITTFSTNDGEDTLAENRLNTLRESSSS